MLVYILRKQIDGPEKNWSRMGVFLYWESVENQSLCCDEGILIYVFSTRETSLVIKIRTQRKN